MTSIRVPSDLLEDLHRAAPPGVSLQGLLRHLLALSGGSKVVRETLAAEAHRAAGKAQVARLRKMGHRSVVLDEGQQVALAEAAGDWRRGEEEAGVWKRTGPRSLHYRGRFRATRAGIRLVRRGLAR